MAATDCNEARLRCATPDGVRPRRFEADFTGGALTADGGALLMGLANQSVGLFRRVAACFSDHRDPAYVVHEVETLVGQRILGLTLGYEDLNDHDALRKDPLLGAVLGRLEKRRDDCEPLAGKSTLNRLELAAAARLDRKHRKVVADFGRFDALLAELFAERFRGAAEGAGAGLGRHRRAAARRPGGALLPWLLPGVLLPAAVGVLRRRAAARAAAASLFDETDLVDRSDAYPASSASWCAAIRAGGPSWRASGPRAAPGHRGVARGRIGGRPRVGRSARLKGADKIGVRVGKVVGTYKYGQALRLLDIEEDSWLSARPESHRRGTGAGRLVRSAQSALRRRRRLTAETHPCASALQGVLTARVERRLPNRFKTEHLKVRPVFHRTADRVRAHVLLCMLAYYVEWHMRARLKPLLFDDHDPAAAEAARTSIVAPARVSEAAREKARGKRTADGLPVHSFRTLLGDLATIAKNRVVPRLPGAEPFEVLTRPTALQREAFKLLGVRP